MVLLSSGIFHISKSLLPHIKNGAVISIEAWCSNIIDAIVIFLFAIIAIFPTRFGLVAYIAFIYAFEIIPTDPENYMGLLMFGLGICFLATRRFFKERRKLKICVLILIYMGVLMLNFRFGLERFPYICIHQTGGILVLVLIVFLVHNYDVDTLMFQDKKLNLAAYPGLDIRDCDILQRIQKKEKYSSIARDIALSEGALKNRLHVVFKTLGVGDRNGFLAYYSDWEIFYNPNSTDISTEEPTA